MPASDYLRALRRRWPIVAVCFVLALALGYLGSRPAAPAAPTGPAAAPSYQATAILSPSSTATDPTGLSLDSMAFLASSGPVSSMTSAALHGSLTAAEVSSQVQPTAKDTLGVLQVTATATTPAAASTLANVFSRQLIAYLNQKLYATWTSTLASDNAQIAALSKVLSKLRGQPSSSLVQAELSQVQNEYVTDSVAYEQLQAQGPQHTTLAVLQAASPTTATIVAPASSAGTSTGHSLIPKSRKKLLLFAGLAGLLVGLALALLRERLDDTVRTRDQAEKVFGLPVLGELPALQRGRRGLVLLNAPASAAAESYRMLQTALAATGGSGSHGSRRQAILLTSAYEVDAKDRVVANLAASFSEAGRSVALLSMDSYDSSLPALVVPGRPAAARGRTAGPLMSSTQPVGTVIDGVSLFVDGVRPGIGSGRNEQHLRLVEEARLRADVVLVDTPPALLTHDAGQLAAAVDAVVLMCPAGEVKSRDAALLVDSLRRVGAPLDGVVILAAEPSGRRLLRLLRAGGAPARRPAPAAATTPAAAQVPEPTVLEARYVETVSALEPPGS